MSTTDSAIAIRWAKPTDVPTMIRFIQELADYEREPESAQATAADLLRDGFSLAADGVTPLTPPAPQRFRCFIAEYNNEPAGMALCFNTYSTWRGHHGLWVEDLYVTPSLRGRGIGKALLRRAAQLAQEEGCPRLEWSVLAWNTPAIAVYERVNATMMNEWRIMRVTDDTLIALATNKD